MDKEKEKNVKTVKIKKKKLIKRGVKNAKK
jgi:hypothetical protein